MSLFKSLAVVVLAVCVGCSAQSSSNTQSQNKLSDAQLNRRIQDQIRAHFSVPPQVNITVGAPKPSDFSGYDAVTVAISDGDKSKNYEFLLSKDGKTLARLSKIDLSKDPYEENMAKIDIANRPVRGNKDAKVTIVNYDDFECPFCARMHSELVNVLKQYGDKVRIIYKDYPLTEIHPWADRAAVDSNCIASQNTDAYWDFADYVHSNQPAITGKKEEHRSVAAMQEAVDKVTLDIGRKHSLNVDQLQACIKNQSESAALKKSVSEANGLDVSATPTMFVNGEKLEGAIEEDALIDVIKKHLQEQGSTGTGASK
ncbi:DSBA oxidoreductase [Candidatus Koribacter versatilis Ellin345]|uniref:DSBA oxidoreductase n=1 Tax=Koribacter versatilis (strain Ellin345) TaxID=204669 RepID=Q1IVD7_KORVE|nr:thioredoxin domain-containing protein [Candidatus Koribacter versatilis]ABF39163.1 DSBA oxidoreductase [Candidatus Koribacter versatilis Ellin345]